MARTSEPPVVLAKGYDLAKWLLARIESFPKNQCNAISQRLTDRTLGIMEERIEASYTPAGRNRLRNQLGMRSPKWTGCSGPPRDRLRGTPRPVSVPAKPTGNAD